MPSVIALDAMGSDKAPKPEIEGAILAARQLGIRVLLVGQEAVVRAELDRHRGASRLPIDIVHASEVITMEDKAVQAEVKAKPSLDSVRKVDTYLRQVAEKSGMTQEEIGLRMGFAKGGARQAVSRILNPENDYDPRLSTLLAFAKAVNKSFREIL